MGPSNKSSLASQSKALRDHFSAAHHNIFGIFPRQEKRGVGNFKTAEVPDMLWKRHSCMLNSSWRNPVGPRSFHKISLSLAYSLGAKLLDDFFNNVITQFPIK